MSQGDGWLSEGIFKTGGARSLGFMNNIGIEAATTTNAADSIRITSADGTALGQHNVGYLTLPSATTGLLTVFRMVADVTILLTGAHWGLGTFGDQTDFLLSLYAINDNGTLKWGVGSVPNHKVILNADDQTTNTSVTQVNHVLVTSALAGDANCLEIGYFKANFDDAGGAAEDLWAVQTGIGDIAFGPCPGQRKKWTPTITGFGNVSNTFFFWLKLRCDLLGQGTFTAGTVAAALASLDLPTGLVIDANALSIANTTAAAGPDLNGVWTAHTANPQRGTAVSATGTSTTLVYAGSNATPLIPSNGSGTFASSVVTSVAFRVPIVGWS